MNTAIASPVDDAVSLRTLQGVDFHAVPAERAIALLDTHIRLRVPIKVAFANAHTLNTATVNPRYREVLAGFAVFNDGVGVDLASHLRFGKRFPDNLNGTDFVPAYLQHSERNLRIFLLGARPHVVQQAFEKTRARFPRHEWVGFHDGYFSFGEEAALLAELRQKRIDLLLVAMGNPLQEFWIDRCAAASRATVCVGVGALFDFLSGEVRRAPGWVRAFRLEWGYRLLLEPARLWRRYLVGNFTFLPERLARPVMQFALPRPPIFHIAGAALAIGAGALVSVAPWWLAFGALGGIAVALGILASPFFGVMLTLALAAQAIPGVLVPSIPMGGALIQAHELVLLATLASAAINALLDGNAERRIDGAFVVLTVITFIALGLSFLASHSLMGQRDFAFPVLRNFLPLALLPFLPGILGNARRVALSECLIISFGTLIALFIAIQSFSSIQLLGGRFEDLGLDQTTGVTRTVLWGPELLIILALLQIVRRGARFALSHLWPLPVTAILLLGLMGTYTRTFWISTVICIGLLTLFTTGIRGCLRLAALIVPAIAVVLVAVYAVNPRIGEATLDRAFGIGQEIESGESFGWRGKENAMAIDAIAKNPWLGIGFNGAYKKSISTRGHFAGEEIYIHNAYLYFQLKMGLLGSLIPAAFLGLYLRLMATSLSISDTGRRATALSYGVLGVAIMLIGYSGQTISRFVTLLIICLMFTVMRFYAARN